MLSAPKKNVKRSHCSASQTKACHIDIDDSHNLEDAPMYASDDNVVRMCKAYYSDYFPHEEVCKLLGREWQGKNVLPYREIAVETHDDRYVRWLSVSSVAELRNMLVEKNTCKVHVGAIFEQQPIHRKSVSVMQATQREFVVDVDVNDYVNTGVDSNEINACDAAWPIVAFGMVIVNRILREKFGFLNTLIVYSGRRGAHLTVYDARACALTDEARDAIVSYIQPSDTYNKIMSEGYFGSLWATILKFWTKHCLKRKADGGGGFLDSCIDREDFMGLLGMEEIKRRTNVAVLTGKETWACVWRYALDSQHQEIRMQKVKSTVLSYVWPRLDANVSKQRNHLNKAWFSLHPKTGRLCVPIIGHPGCFDPSKCPRLDEVVRGNPVHRKAFKASVAGFSNFVDHLEASPSEQWSPPRTQIPMPLVYCMVGQKRAHDEQCGQDDGDYILQHRSRLCYNVQRVFCATSTTAEPNFVRLAWYTVPATEDPIDSVTKIYPGYSPPYRIPGNFPLDRFMAAIEKATCTPETEIECDRAYVCVLLDQQDQSMGKAMQRFVRMCPGLAKLNRAGDVSSRWKYSEKETVINLMVKPVWDVERIFL